MLPAVRISVFAEAILDTVYASSHQLLSRTCTEQTKIIKNRLRSTLCDEWMKVLMDLTSEKDVLLSSISHDEVIDNFEL